MQRDTGINESEIRNIMRDAEIQSVSIASGKDENNIASTPIVNEGQGIERYGAASLSKPVFTYLTLKLIGSNNFELDTQLNTIFPFGDFCKKFDIEWDNSEENIARVNQFTPAMILSHKTGIPIGYKSGSGPLKFDFDPDKGFGYSGLHLMYLQECLQIKFKLPLEELAKKHVFVPAKMTNSSFDTPVANAANSLHTTAEDYVRFCLYWMKDPDPRVQDAFESKVSMLDDPWAVREGIPETTLSHLSWGYGWGLEKDDKGNVSAFHTGDMNEWRAGVKLNLTDRSVKVFFSTSSYENGHLLQDQILGRSYALDYFFDKFKYARTPNELKEDWRENPCYGIRKESVKNIDRKMSSTTDIYSAISSNPIEAAKQRTPSTLNAITVGNPISTSEVSPSPTTPIQETEHQTSTPLPIKPTPQGTNKK